MSEQQIILPNGWTIIPDRNVSDIAPRSWKERLFSRPWRPFVRVKHEPKAFLVLDEFILVSYASFEKLKLDSPIESKK